MPCPCIFTRMSALARNNRYPTIAARHFHASSSTSARGTKIEEMVTAEQAVDLLDDDFDDDDTASGGHLMLREHRQLLHYLRLIEHDMPKLVGESVR